MRKVLVFCTLATATIFGCSKFTHAQAGQPDFGLAYQLATASFCAYAVGDSFAGVPAPDKGRKRAFDCLKAAVKADPTHLAGLDVQNEDDVEGFSAGDGRAFDAYLLANAPMGVVLAFRGTLLPPVSPQEAKRLGLPDELARLVNAKVRGAWESFFSDWGNNFVAKVDNKNRHDGFDKSWTNLKDHLSGADCNKSTANCSKFSAFVAPLAGGRLKTVYITGHSKGGALATLAGLDLKEIAPTTWGVVYNFAAAKSVAQTTEPLTSAIGNGFWRFEHEGDIVPTLPTDDSLIKSIPFIGKVSLPLPFKTFSHLGRRVFFNKDESFTISSPREGRDEPDDAARWKTILGIEGDAIVDFLAKTIQGREATFDCPMIDSHFAVFNSIQAQAWARDERATTAGRTSGYRFFQEGLPDANGDIIPGYLNWCKWLTFLP